MQERELKKCKICNELKVRMLDRKIGKDKIWVSDNGRAWNGRTCGDCHIEQVRQKTRIRRQGEK